MTIDFKNEEEVKEYIENLGIEYRYGCFSEKKPEVCHLLGDYLDAIKKDYHKAARIYKSNCEDYNHPRSCHAYGNYALTGKGQDKQNYEVAYNYFLKACNMDIGTSCFNAGILAVTNNPKWRKEKDYTKGLELLDKACNLKNVHGCYYLSGLYISGTKDEAVGKDMSQAFKYSEKACDLGNLFACVNLSIMYKKGEGVEKNEEMAEKFKKKAEEIKEELDSAVTIEFQRN